MVLVIHRGQKFLSFSRHFIDFIWHFNGIHNFILNYTNPKMNKIWQNSLAKNLNRFLSAVCVGFNLPGRAVKCFIACRFGTCDFHVSEMMDFNKSLMSSGHILRFFNVLPWNNHVLLFGCPNSKFAYPKRAAKLQKMSYTLTVGEITWLAPPLLFLVMVGDTTLIFGGNLIWMLRTSWLVEQPPETHLGRPNENLVV